VGGLCRLGVFRGCWDSGGYCDHLGQKLLERGEVHIGHFSVAVPFQNVEDRFTWTFSRVNGPKKIMQGDGLWGPRESWLKWLKDGMWVGV
jgi:hypothetical protein